MVYCICIFMIAFFCRYIRHIYGFQFGKYIRLSNGYLSKNQVGLVSDENEIFVTVHWV